jgi:hypothetical protein
VDQQVHPARSILGGQIVVSAFTASVLVHLLAIVLWYHNVPRLTLEFWFFAFTDAVLWALVLIPLFAAWKGRLAWHDPLLVLSPICLGTFCALFVAYLMDPTFVLWVANRGSRLFQSRPEHYVLALWTEAELICILFLGIVLLTNHRVIIYPAENRFSPRQYRAAFATSVVLLLAGVYGFLMLWSGSSFVETLVLDMGSYRVAPDQVRYHTLQTLAVQALPLGIVALFGLRTKPGHTPGKFLHGVALVSVVLSILPGLVYGARATVVYRILTYLILLRQFGVIVSRKTLLSLAAVGLMIIAATTLLRGNWHSGDSVVDVVDTVISGELLRSYLAAKRSRVGSLLDADRITIVAFIIENTSRRGAFVNGASLIAGAANLVEHLFFRFLRPLVSQSSKRYFLNSHDYINIWRFGTTFLSGRGSNPPSYAGEFFMQYGYPSLIALSFALGVSLRWMRRRIAASQTVLSRWFWVSFCVYLVLYSPAQISLLFKVLYAPLLPIVGLCSFLYIAFGPYGRKVSGPSDCTGEASR